MLLRIFETYKQSANINVLGNLKKTRTDKY